MLCWIDGLEWGGDLRYEIRATGWEKQETMMDRAIEELRDDLRCDISGWKSNLAVARVIAPEASHALQDLIDEGDRILRDISSDQL